MSLRKERLNRSIIAAMLQNAILDISVHNLRLTQTMFCELLLSGDRNVNMTKSDRQDIALVVGAGVLLFGILVLYGAVSSEWAIQTAASNATGIIGGGFLCVLGVVIIGAALDVLDELGGVVQGIWDSFLDAIGR